MGPLPGGIALDLRPALGLQTALPADQHRDLGHHVPAPVPVLASGHFPSPTAASAKRVCGGRAAATCGFELFYFDLDRTFLRRAPCKFACVPSWPAI